MHNCDKITSMENFKEVSEFSDKTINYLKEEAFNENPRTGKMNVDVYKKNSVGVLIKRVFCLSFLENKASELVRNY